LSNRPSLVVIAHPTLALTVELPQTKSSPLSGTENCVKAFAVDGTWSIYVADPAELPNARLTSRGRRPMISTLSVMDVENHPGACVQRGIRSPGERVPRGADLLREPLRRAWRRAARDCRR